MLVNPKMRSHKSGLFFSRKKSIRAAINFLVGIILIMVSAIVLFSAYSVVYANIKSSSAREICRLSVLAKEKTSQLSSAGTRLIESPTRLECYTNFISVRNNGIFKQFRKKDGTFSEEKKSKSSSEDDIKRVIADEMFDCWYQFGQGKLKPFTQGIRCMMCSQISFDSSVSQRYSRIQGLNNYLETHTPKDSKDTYLQYLTNGKSSGAVPALDIDTSKVYYVSYVSALVSTWQHAGALCAGGTIAGTTIGLLFGGLGAVPGTAIGGVVGCGTGLWTLIAYRHEGGLIGAMSVRFVPAEEVSMGCEQFY